MIRIYEIAASLVMTPPSGRARIFLDTDGFIKAKLDDGSLIVLSVTPEYIQDIVGSFFGDSGTINFTYDDNGNVASMDVIMSALDISQIPNVPQGNLTAVTVQAALNELQSSIDASDSALADHLADPTDAHDASAISVVPTGNLSATNAQSAFNELQQDVDSLNSDLDQEILDRQNADANLQTQIDNITSTAVENAQDAVAAALAAGTQDGVSASYNDAGNAINLTNTDKGSVARTAHEAAADPHPQYTTVSEASAAAPVQSVNGQTGAVSLTTSEISEGSNLYFTTSRVLNTLLTGLSLLTGGVISATDSILVAFGKLQKQISDNLTTLNNHISDTANPHNTTAAQVGAYTTAQTDTEIADAITAHEAAVDPHPQYLTPSEGNAAYTPLSHVGSGGAEHANATTSVSGFMSATDKAKLDGISGTRIIKSGTIAGAAFAGAPRTATVTFATPFPNTNYSIHITGANSRSWSFQAKANGSFVINSNAIGALAGEVTWTCISYGETVE